MSDLLRIALAESDELAAYHIQGPLRKLERPFSLRRIADQTTLGFELLRFNPDLIIFDYDFDEISSVRLIKDKGSVPVIVLSNSEDPNAEAKSRQAGADAFVPISSWAILPGIIEETLSQSRLPKTLWGRVGDSKSSPSMTISL